MRLSNFLKDAASQNDLAVSSVLEEAGNKCISSFEHQTTNDDELRAIASDAGISRTCSITGFDELDVPVTISIRPRAAHPLAIVNSGRGLSYEHAKISAIFEGVERWSAEPANIPVVKAKWHEVEDLHAEMGVRPFGLSLPPDTTLNFCAAEDLLTNKLVLVPVNRVSFPSVVEDRVHPKLYADTNGLACGRNAALVLASGLYELIERHQVSQMTPRVKMIDLRSISDDAIKKILSKTKEKRIEIAIRVMRPFKHIFVVHVFGYNTEEPWPQLFCSGAGCDTKIHTAILGALTEFAQSRCAYLSMLREDIPRNSLKMIATGFKRQHEYLKQWLEVHRSTVDFLALQESQADSCTLSDLIDSVSKLSEGLLFAKNLTRLACVPAYKVSAFTLGGAEKYAHGSL